MMFQPCCTWQKNTDEVLSGSLAAQVLLHDCAVQSSDLRKSSCGCPAYTDTLVTTSQTGKSQCHDHLQAEMSLQILSQGQWMLKLEAV